MTIDWKKFVGLAGQLAVDFSKDDNAAMLTDARAIVVEVISEVSSHPVAGPKLMQYIAEASLGIK